jgi:6-phosphofructokinase 1
MDTIKKLSDYGKQINSPIRFMGVPKTIDNDLAITDHTPGYGSAAKYIAATTKEIIRDGLVYDYPVVTVIEVMGRNAGWLTAATALAKGEDCEGVDDIYLPERVFDVDAFVKRVGEQLKEGRSIVIAVSEGVKVADGRYVCELSDHVDYVDAFGHKQLAGTARYLAGKVAEVYGVKTRAIELSSLQRCAAHIQARQDMTEAYNCGGAAVKAAFEGKTGLVITLKRVSDDPYMCITEEADVHEIANIEKKVPLEWITEDGTNVKQELVHYIFPLIQAEITPLWVNGLPRHIRLHTKSTIEKI